jgi:hypothetical protein
MKNIFKYLAGAAALFALASCDLNKTPVFEDSESFASFDKTSIVVNEDAGKVQIPVTIASKDPKQVAVAYQAVDGTAKAGVNFSLVDESAVLSFDGKTRTMYLEFEVKNVPGVYTGDVTFTFELVSAGNLKLGANKTCSVRIADLDHPLAAILGDYTVAGKENWDGDLTWNATFSKDDSDISVVWITGLSNDQYSSTTPIYGNVSADMTTITIPFGQTCPVNSTYHGVLVGFGPFDGKLYYGPEGNIILTKTDAGWVQSTSKDEDEEKWGYAWFAYTTSTGDPYSWLTGFHAGVVFTKK